MTRLHDAFDTLVADQPQRGADDVLAATRAALATDPPVRPAQRRPAWTAVAAAVALVLVIAALTVVRHRDDRQRVTSTPTTTTTSTTTPSTTAVGHARTGLVPPEGAVIAAPDGVQVEFDTAPIPLTDQPTALAFAGRAPGPDGRTRWVAAYQDRGADVGGVITPAGPVRVIQGATGSTIVPTDDAASIRLLDLRIDSRGVRVLAAEAIAPDDPATVRERLVVIDPATGDQTTVVDRAARESTTRWARLLPDGSVVALQVDGIYDNVVRWEPGRATPVFHVEAAVDTNLSVVADEERVTAMVLGREDDGTPTFRTRTLDARTGAELGTGALTPKIDGHSPLQGLSCLDQLADGRPLCSSPMDGVVVLDADGTAHPVRGSTTDAVATAGRG